MQKIYSRINWENFPSEKTAVNESNLNKMDLAIDNLDDRGGCGYHYPVRQISVPGEETRRKVHRLSQRLLLQGKPRRLPMRSVGRILLPVMEGPLPGGRNARNRILPKAGISSFGNPGFWQKKRD